jgi:hypothetical protein
MIADAMRLPIDPFICENPPAIEEGLQDDEPPMSGFAAAACRQLPIAVDTDQELLAKFAGNTATASAYVATLFAGMNDIYTSDFNVRPSICYLRWWTTTDPWTIASGTSAQLTEFRTYWNTNMRAQPRSLATLLSARSLGGGVAWLSQVCASTSGSGYGYSVSANLNGTFPYPVISRSSSNWDIIVTSHEIGHNMSALHTHEVGVDDCYLSDGSGLGACTQRTSSPGYARVISRVGERLQVGRRAEIRQQQEAVPVVARQHARRVHARGRQHAAPGSLSTARCSPTPLAPGHTSLLLLQ